MAARASGLVRGGEPLLVLLSGGADSVCLLDVCVRLGARVSALHVNYGLREGADGDEALCRELCERLGVALTVEHVSLASAAGEGAVGNLQAEARAARYAAAERLVGRGGGDYAAAHTASDQAETVVYRLATSPGRRALLGMAARRGRLVRPLLAVPAAKTHGYCEERGLAWREDPSNADPRFARARVRHQVMPLLSELSPAAERTIAETTAVLRDEQAVLDGAVDGALERLGGPAVSLAAVRELGPGLARLVLERLAANMGATAVALSRADANALLGLGERGGTRSRDLGGGLTAIVEYGTLRFATAPVSEPVELEPVQLPVPGTVRFGAWQVEARPMTPGEPGGGDGVGVSAAALGDGVTVRGWRDGDRMRPLGLGGSKSLQDLFTDLKVPRELRRTLPVAEVEDEVVWVAGVALAEGLGELPLVRLSARRVER